jgi:glycerol-3-phosphate dehydrogenase
LCAAASEYFKNPIKPKDVVWSYSGVRPLYDDGEKNASKATRDYVLDLKDAEGAAPLLNIYGGKITTHRCLAEEVMEKIAPFINDTKGNWTKGALLPGGDMPAGKTPSETLNSFIEAMTAETPWLDHQIITRMVHAYGTRITHVLDGATSITDMGQDFGAGLYAREITYLMKQEWAQTADDILWRRSKLGLHMTKQQRQAVADWIQQQPSA